MKYLLTVEFSKRKIVIVFNSYVELLKCLRKNLIKDFKDYKDSYYLWKYTIETIKEGGE